MANVKKTFVKQIENEDKLKLMAAWHKLSSLKDLINSNLNEQAFEIVLAKHQVAYVEYNDIWDDILLRYFDINTAKDNVDYNCDFKSNTVIVIRK